MLSHHLEVDISAERIRNHWLRGVRKVAREAHTSERHLSHARTFTRFLHARTPALEPTRAMHQDHTMKSAGRTNVRKYAPA